MLISLFLIIRKNFLFFFFRYFFLLSESDSEFDNNSDSDNKDLLSVNLNPINR